MFEFFFKYPVSAFQKGEIVFLGRWPIWLLAACVIAAAAVLAFLIFRGRTRHAKSIRGLRPAFVWLMQTMLVALVLLMLWQPALSIATLRPQQNVVAVVVDDSRSMSMADEGTSRKDLAARALDSGLLKNLAERFQVRLYRAGTVLERIDSTAKLKADGTATRIGETMKQMVAESSSLPLGAVVLLSDGADNAGGIDLPTINDIRKQRIPVHTIGFGKEKPRHDIELSEVEIPHRALAESRLNAVASFVSHGYSGQRARLTLKDGEKVLATREVTLRDDGVQQSESLAFQAGNAGPRNLQLSVDPLTGEENAQNNRLTRVINVEPGRPRILYIEGEPKWEFKFIRRASESDTSLRLVTILRTTQNKIYRQGIDEPKELEDGFPSTSDELFKFQGIILGGVEANYFTPTQIELLRQFVDRRGGGLLMLGGRNGLSDGGWAQSPVAELLPVVLPNRKGTFVRDPATVDLTPAGRDHLMCRLEDNPDRNVERWKKLPYLQNYHDPGVPKPGAVVLAEMMAPGRGKMPLLTLQNYGRGRTAVLATSGTWRWQMSQPVSDLSHEMFWQQLMRWLVTGTAGHVVASTQKSVFADDMKVPLRVEVRDKTYLSAADARVEAHIMGPDGRNETVELQPDPTAPGIYTSTWAAEKPGAYVAEVVAFRGTEEAGRDVISFRREDGVAENFRTYQNRELLEKLSQQTGGRYYKPDEAGALGKEIAFSEAGISTREVRDLWNMPFLFLLALALRTGEWLLRRKWGVV